MRLPPGTWIEHEEFSNRVRKGDFEGALDLYRGVLFPQDLYADWSVWERERLGQRYLQALLGAAGRALESGHPREALALARRALAQEPWQEQATRIGMEACLALDDRAGALRLYRALVKCLREDLDIEPGEALQAFYRSI